MARLKLKIPDYAKFSSGHWKALLIDNGFFLYGEWESALKTAGFEVVCFQIRHRDCAVPSYYRKLTSLIDAFRPDFVFSINFIGFDQEGRLASMFRVLNIPVVYWLIDHPFRFLPFFLPCLTDLSRLTVIDQDWQQLLKKDFNLESHYLPLAVTDAYDSQNFLPNPSCDISFIGTTGIDEIEEFSCYKPNLSADKTDAILLELATLLSKNRAKTFLEIYDSYLENKNLTLEFNSVIEEHGFQLSITALADFLYRKKHLKLLTSKNALIYGDERWSQFLTEVDLIKPWPDLTEKYTLYHNSKINVNLSSFFLTGSFNRKFLEIPLCGGFVLTDYRKCYEEFYKQDIYHYFTHLSGLGKEIDYYLSHPRQRTKQVEHARDYILKHHTYQQRVEELKDFLSQEFMV